MRGRKPTPTHLKLLQGTFRPDRAQSNEPQPAAELPPAPDYLNAVASREWDRLAPQLYAAGLLTSFDLMALEALCKAYARWRKAEEQVDVEGEVIQSPRGPVRNPWVLIQSKAYEQMTKMLIEFGFTPSARSRVTAIPTDGENDDGFDFG